MSNKIIIDKAELKKDKLTIEELITLLNIKYKVIPAEYHNNLLKKGFICEDEYDKIHKFYISTKGKRVLEEVIIKDSHSNISNEELNKLAIELQLIFPEGKKPGTSYYWRGGLLEIVKKLKGFFNKYGNTYSKEDIIKATKKYVNYYNNNLTYMQLLKYFIWKLKDNGEEISELASYLDNLDNEDTINNDDWLTNLI